MNQFLVEIFHEVLRREDAAIASGDFRICPPGRSM